MIQKGLIPSISLKEPRNAVILALLGSLFLTSSTIFIESKFINKDPIVSNSEVKNIDMPSPFATATPTLQTTKKDTPPQVRLQSTTSAPTLSPTASPTNSLNPTNTPIPAVTANPTFTPTPTTAPSNQLHVISPNGGETFTIGQTATITWTGSGDFDEVHLYYLTQNGFSRGIANNVGVAGSFSWTVASDFPTETQYKIGISGIKSGNLIANPHSDNYFTILPAPTPTIDPSCSQVTFSQDNNASETVIHIYNAWNLTVHADPQYSSIDYDEANRVINFHFSVILSSGSILIYKDGYQGAPLCRTYQWSR